MSSILIITYIVINVGIFILYYSKEYGICQTPALFSIVSLVFITPQLFEIQGFVQDPDQYMSLPLLAMISCNIGLTLGFKIGRDSHTAYIEPTTLNWSRIWMVILFFAVVGLGATFMNRGVYKGGKMSGTFVIIQFFASYLDYLLITILACIYKKISIPKLFYILFVVIVLVQIDKFLISARRGAAIQFILTLTFFYFLLHSKKHYERLKWIIPTFFILGLYFNSQIAEYRSNAYSGKMTVAENIEDMEFTFEKKTVSLYGNETNNAIRGINETYKNGVYDFGTYNWNGIIQNFVPSFFGGREFKESLKFSSNNKYLINKLTESGSTMTGYYDAFSSFGVLCWAKFMLIGFILGRLWKNSKNSVISLILYTGLFSSSLHVITHASNHFVSELVFFAVFIYPLLKICELKQPEELPDS